MKIAIAYPPFGKDNKIPLLAQNRQFQWATSPWTAYPMVPAMAATLLSQAGHEVLWLDGVNEQTTMTKWQQKLLAFNPDLIFFETKTPVIKLHWHLIHVLKTKNCKLTIVLAGDHPTALPEESFGHSPVDYVLTGGDYDQLLVNLAHTLTKTPTGYALRQPAKLLPGIYYRHKNKVLNTGHFQLTHSLDSLPFIDRKLTHWSLYSQHNSNYRQIPGTYTMFSRDCWWGKCTFCSWTTLYPGKTCRTVSVTKALTEVEYLVNTLGVKEIMDDSGTFPVGDWLRAFCHGLISKGLNKRVTFNCNMRFASSLTQADYYLMKEAGFRLLLFGFESANQKTLDRLHKNLAIDTVVPTLQMLKNARLSPHLTVMLGYPWETRADIVTTYRFVRSLVNANLIASLQATLIIPYPGTPLFQEAVDNNWLTTTNWSDYAMTKPVLSSDLSEAELKHFIRQFYALSLQPKFVLAKASAAIRSVTTLKYYLRLVRLYFSRQKDFT